MDFFGAEENIGLAHMLPNLECLQQSGRAEVVVWRVVAFQENNKKKPKIKKLKQSSTYRKVGKYLQCAETHHAVNSPRLCCVLRCVGITAQTNLLNIN